MVTHIKTIGREETWNFPHTIRAIDGKDRIECTKHSGGIYYNHKRFYKFPLLTVCEGNYCFTLLDLDQYGSDKNAGVLANSKFGK